MRRGWGIFAWTIIMWAGTLSSVVAADAPAVQPTVPASIWWVPLASALIGAISALVTPFLKDTLIHKWSERRAKLDGQHEVFRNYAAPLTASSEKLVWRFNEIFIENRHQFLKTATLPLVYNEYKRKSTLYRVAGLLGWIRAIHLELSALPRGASGFLTPISTAIWKIQSALADGPHVEVHRLEQLSAVWRLEIGSLSDERKRQLATKVEIKLYDLAGDKLKHDSEHLQHMEDGEKMKICRSLVDFLCDELRHSRLNDGIVSETMNQAVAAASYHEALIYRDWQDAIGDVMLEKDTDSVRRFRIIGYEKFESVLMGHSLWMEVFRDSIKDIDFDTINPNDFRAKQLKDLAVAVCHILISLSQTEEKDLINDAALHVAHQIVKMA